MPVSWFVASGLNPLEVHHLNSARGVIAPIGHQSFTQQKDFVAASDRIALLKIATPKWLSF